LHIVISGSSPDVSMLKIYKNKCIKYSYVFIYKYAREAQPGRAELWRCLGCKFKSYLEQRLILTLIKTIIIFYTLFVYKFVKVMMELVDMNSLGLFDF
jgi:hypothetical protein